MAGKREYFAVFKKLSDGRVRAQSFWVGRRSESVNGGAEVVDGKCVRVNGIAGG